MGFFKYHGAGNDFILADNRSATYNLSGDDVRSLCDRHTGIGSDGLMLLENSPLKAFSMKFFNPDGSGGMMCGNGGRCIAAFALSLGILPGPDGHMHFDAPDGPHEAIFPEYHGGSDAVAKTVLVRLKMKDVPAIKVFPELKACFLDTGTRHLVKFVSSLKDYPVAEQGARLRHDPHFSPQGVNVNFIESSSGGLAIRTFEKGVEAETLSCGTGIVASALAAYSQGIAAKKGSDGRVECSVSAAIETLKVDFLPSGSGESFSASDIWLTGSATKICSIEI